MDVDKVTKEGPSLDERKIELVHSSGPRPVRVHSSVSPPSITMRFDLNLIVFERLAQQRNLCVHCKKSCAERRLQQDGISPNLGREEEEGSG